MKKYLKFLSFALVSALLITTSSNFTIKSEDFGEIPPVVDEE